jgi:hypothetical protein
LAEQEVPGPSADDILQAAAAQRHRGKAFAVKLGDRDTGEAVLDAARRKAAIS